MHKLTLTTLLALTTALIFGCPPPTVPNTTGDGTTSGDVSDQALSFGGTVSGSVLTAAATDGQPDLGSGRKYFSRSQGAGATAWLTDLDGNPLLDAESNVYGEFPVNADGTFTIGELPVGVDIILHVDLDGDGEADLETIIHIPQDENATGGSLDGADVDPVSTLVYAKLLDILAQWGLNPEDLELSPSGLVGQTRDAFESLFEAAGIFAEIDVDDIMGMTLEELAALFETLIPAGARNGMTMAHHRIGLTVAADAEEIALAVAQILLEGGMIVAEKPGGLDLSSLADLPNVETKTFDEFFTEQHGGAGTRGDQEMSGKGLPPDFALPVPDVGMVVYIHTAPELDRNHFGQDDMGPGMKGPMFGEDVLLQMAEAYLDGLTISLDELHTILTDPVEGLGVRLTYTKFTGDHNSPHVEVFETLDGQGVELNLWGPGGLLAEIMDLGMLDPSPEAFERHEAKLRKLLADFLHGTVAPTLEQLLSGVYMDRVPSADEFARIIRGLRIHVPWSLSGPARMWVVATADPWADDSADPVTVDVTTDRRGRVETVTYNSAGTGDFYLTQLWPTDGGQMVELVRTRNGRPLHDHEGNIQQVDMADDDIFAPVGGGSFFDAFSETDQKWPLEPELTVANPWFDPSLPPDPETNPPDHRELVLMDGYRHGASPVLVNYNQSTGIATAAADGQYYLVPDELFWDDGWFAMMKSNGEFLPNTPGGDWDDRVRVDPLAVVDLPVDMQEFTWVYGIDAPNPAYDPEGAPYWDDINADGVQQPGEPVFSERHFLWDPSDWMSTWVEMYYRLGDTGGFPDPRDIDWGAAEPQMMDGTPLVPRNFRARKNGWRFGRPNVTVNLLMAFSPPEFFNGTQAFNGDTRVNPLMVLALVNMIMDGVQTVEAEMDFDGPGPMPTVTEAVPAYYFTPPVGDPVRMLVDGFANYAE